MRISSARNVSCWLQADLQPPKFEVCSTPNFGHSVARAGLPLLTQRRPRGDEVYGHRAYQNSGIPVHWSQCAEGRYSVMAAVGLIFQRCVWKWHLEYFGSPRVSSLGAWSPPPPGCRFGRGRERHERGLLHGQADRHGDVLVAPSGIDRCDRNVIVGTPIDQRLLGRTRGLRQGPRPSHCQFTEGLSKRGFRLGPRRPPAPAKRL